MTKRQFHPRKAKRMTAAEHQLANNTAVLVAAAAGKHLQDRYGWTAAQASAFIDELPAVVTAMAQTINAVFNEGRGG